MRKFLLTLAAAAAASVPALAADKHKGEAELAKAIAGRTAGEPVSCISLRDIRSSRIVDRTAIVYEGPGGTLYVNRPRGGASSLDHWDVLVTKLHGGSQLCRTDSVTLYDSGSRMQTGFVILDDFVPYRKP